LPGQGHLKRAGTGDLVLTGGPAVPPARKDLSVIDSVTRIAKAVGLTGAHFAAARTGPGRMSMSRSTMRRSTS
jgi:crotonobetainyl-CoA:carnitine CoA-transferase CaiB-like acyl-CoA transferase